MYFRFFGEGSPVLDGSLSDISVASGVGQCIIDIVYHKKVQLNDLTTRFSPSVIAEAVKAMGEHISYDEVLDEYQVVDVDCDYYTLLEGSIADNLRFLKEQTVFFQNFYLQRGSNIYKSFSVRLVYLYFIADNDDREHMMELFPDIANICANICIEMAVNEYRTGGEFIFPIPSKVFLDIVGKSDLDIKFYTIDISGKDSKLKKRRRRLHEFLKGYVWRHEHTVFLRVEDYSYMVVTSDDFMGEFLRGKHYVLREVDRGEL